MNNPFLTTSQRIAGVCSAVLVLACAGAGCEPRRLADREGDATAPPVPVAGTEAPRSLVKSSASEGQELKAVSTPDGRVTAHFMGTPPAADGEFAPPPLEYGVESLSFTFSGDQRRYPFKPTGKLYFSDWRFDIFSPDGAHVLLLQDRFGPYHVVTTRQLRDYLLGKVGPEHEVAYWPSPHGFVPVHEKARWIAATEFEFVAGSETPRAIRYTLSSGELSPTSEKPRELLP